MKSRRVWRASEAIAESLLEDMGFRVVGRHVRIDVGGVEVGEVDLVAERGGVRYAVEVKAGPVDVSGLRQAYVNALLLGAKPLVVARGYADESAEALARRLGVEVLVLPDALPLTPEDVYETVKYAVEEALEEVLDALTRCHGLGGRELEVVRALASSETFTDAAQRLGVSVDELGSIVAGLRRKGLLRARGPFSKLRLESRLLLLCLALRGGGSG